MGTEILTYENQVKHLNHWNGRVVNRISKSEITFILFTGPTRKEAPKPILMTMEDIDSYYDPNENEGNYENQ